MRPLTLYRNETFFVCQDKRGFFLAFRAIKSNIVNVEYGFEEESMGDFKRATGFCVLPIYFLLLSLL